MKREEMLNEAEHLISSERQKDYGDFQENLTRIGEYWGIFLGIPPIPAERVAVMYSLAKISRLTYRQNKDDTWVDAIAYLAGGGEIATEGNNVN